MIPKDRKVERDIFPTFPQKGKVFNSNSLNLKVYSNPLSETNKTKFSFIVSKKVSNKAVKRNLLKKRGYSILDEVLDKTKDGFVCIFFFKKESLGVDFNDLKKEILLLLKKSSVI